MALFKLTSDAYSLLWEIARSHANARQVPRAQALLWLHENHTAGVVAQCLGMSWRTIQHWKRQYQERTQDSVLERIQEGEHTGRLPKQSQLAQTEIKRVWRHAPQHYGFRARNWTVPMLRCVIHRRAKTSISRSTVRRNSPGSCIRCCKMRMSRDPMSWLGIRSEALSYVYFHTTMPQKFSGLC